MPAGQRLTRRPTIVDVARVAQVSKGAVSFALNGRPGVAEHTRERILTVAAELGWRPSASARSLSMRRAHAVGLARQPELLGADPFFPPFIAGVETVLARRGNVLVLQVPRNAAAELDGYRRLAADGRVDGVFLSDLRVHDPRPSALAELGLPAITIGRTPKSLLPSVSLDDRPGIEDAVAHLVALGHRRIGHVAGPQHFLRGRARKATWRKVVRAAGQPTNLCVTADFTASGGARATATLLDLVEPPTAIVYANDVMAIAGMSVAASRGVSVPDQLSVTGFDDTELSRHLCPALTTVRSDALGWGVAAAELLLDVVEAAAAQGLARPDRPAQSAQVVHLELPPAQLVLRDSCAPPPSPRPRAAQRRPSPTTGTLPPLAQNRRHHEAAHAHAAGCDAGPRTRTAQRLRRG